MQICLRLLGRDVRFELLETFPTLLWSCLRPATINEGWIDPDLLRIFLFKSERFSEINYHFWKSFFSDLSICNVFSLNQPEILFASVTIPDWPTHSWLVSRFLSENLKHSKLFLFYFMCVCVSREICNWRIIPHATILFISIKIFRMNSNFFPEIWTGWRLRFAKSKKGVRREPQYELPLYAISYFKPWLDRNKRGRRNLFNFFFGKSG